MKTVEEMAEEYERANWAGCKLKPAYLAGHKAAETNLLTSGKWISVKERLPDINEQFLAFIKNKEVGGCRRYQNRSSDDSPIFYAQTKTGLLICGLESITYWMPLPEAPKED